MHRAREQQAVASAWARDQALRESSVTGMLHDVVQLDDASRALLTWLDGGATVKRRRVCWMAGKVLLRSPGRRQQRERRTKRQRPGALPLH